MRILVTGGAGFVGSALVRYLLRETNACVVNVDNLSRSPGASNLEEVSRNTRHFFEKVDVTSKRMWDIFEKYEPEFVFHLAAETDVDRSASDDRSFLQNNIYGTFNLLEMSRRYVDKFKPNRFRLVQLSTSDVYGDSSGTSNESSRFNPVTPYAATKAAADFIAGAWFSTYGIPVITTHATNVYGPCQCRGLIPETIDLALESKPVPVVGAGDTQDWMHVTDLCRGLLLAAKFGRPGETYNFGGNECWTNEQVVRMICSLMDILVPRRQGHHVLVESDKRANNWLNAVDIKKSYDDLVWLPNVKLMQGLLETVESQVKRNYRKAGIEPVDYKEQIAC